MQPELPACRSAPAYGTVAVRSAEVERPMKGEYAGGEVAGELERTLQGSRD